MANPSSGLTSSIVEEKLCSEVFYSVLPMRRSPGQKTVLCGQKEPHEGEDAVRRRGHHSIPIWLALSALLLLVSAGDIAAESATRQIAGSLPTLDTGGNPDTLYGGPANPGSQEGDPNDYDKTIPTTPVWLWIVQLLMGKGR